MLGELFKKKKVKIPKEDWVKIIWFINTNREDAMSKRNIAIIISKSRKDFLSYCNKMESWYSMRTKTNLITDDFLHNKSYFNEEDVELLTMALSDELLDYIQDKIASEDSEQKILKKLKWVLGLIFVYFSIYAILIWIMLPNISSIMLDVWTKWKKINWLEGIATFFIDWSVGISLLLWLVWVTIISYLYLQSFIFYQYEFSKNMLLMNYKKYFRLSMLKHLMIDENDWERSVSFMNTKEEFKKIVDKLYYKISKNDVNNLIFFLQSPDSNPKMKLEFLQGSFVWDFTNFQATQQRDNYSLIKIYDETKKLHNYYRIESIESFNRKVPLFEFISLVISMILMVTLMGLMFFIMNPILSSL